MRVNVWLHGDVFSFYETWNMYFCLVRSRSVQMNTETEDKERFFDFSWWARVSDLISIKLLLF